MKIIRIFPRRTKATPSDENVRIYTDPGLFDEADEIHISVTFTWDLPAADRLLRAWRHVAPVKMGGPALGLPGGEFIPGLYLKKGYTITSRGCPNHCWFCSVWKREGTLRELEIKPGNNILDDNLLACSNDHIKAVISMLKTQSSRPSFTGGLEAKRLKPWQAEALRELKPRAVFFAYDSPQEAEPLREAVQIMVKAGFPLKSHRIRAYVLIGYPGDEYIKAEARLKFVLSLGITPMAMLYRDGPKNKEWGKFQRVWARPELIYGRNQDEGANIPQGL